VDVLYTYIFEKENFISLCKEKKLLLCSIVILVLSILNFSISNMLIHNYCSESVFFSLVSTLLYSVLHFLVLVIFTGILHFVSILLDGDTTVNILSFFSYICFSFLPSFILLPCAIVLSALPEDSILRLSTYNVIVLVVYFLIATSQLKGIMMFYNISIVRSLIVYFSPLIMFFFFFILLAVTFFAYAGLKLNNFFSSVF